MVIRGEWAFFISVIILFLFFMCLTENEKGLARRKAFNLHETRTPLYVASGCPKPF